MKEEYSYLLSPNAAVVIEDIERYLHITHITEEAWWEETLQPGRRRNSRQFCEMLGLGREMYECTISQHRELIHPDDRLRVQASLDLVVQKGVPFREAYRLRHANGHYIWVGDSGRVVLRDAQGNPIRMIGIITDITARKEAEIALQESEARYRLLAEITNEAWQQEDLRAAMLTNSERFCQMLGMGADWRECSLAAYRQLIHPDALRHVSVAHELSIHEGRDFEEIYQLRHSDGHYVWVEHRARVVARDHDGKPTRMLGVLTDITARKLAEIASQESAENFRHLFSDAPDAYLIMDPETLSIIHCNHATERMLRGNLEQIINIAPEKISPAFQPNGRRSLELIQETKQLVLEQGYHRFEWVHRRFDGTDFWVEVTAKAGTYQKRSVLFVIWREISDIIAAKQAAEAASLAKSQFLSAMSHEFRTPLTSIMAMLHLIKKADVNENAQEYAARGLKGSQHLLKLVEDILDFSSVEAGRVVMVREPFRLGTILEEVSHAAEGACQANVSLLVDADTDLRDLELAGDALRLKQVLINLLGNALKFTDKGAVVLAVKRVGGTTNIPLLEFAVDDTGIGLTDDQKDRLFQPFTQVDMSDGRRYGGTGLGLAISQRLVGLMGGEPITVESQAGVGSRFSFRIPLPFAEEHPNPDVAPAFGEPAPDGRPLAGLRVLLVEDSEPIRFAIGLILQSEGAQVDVAADGAEGVKMALGPLTPHDVILMDIQMPVQNGIEATRELRTRGYVRPIVALTASAFSRDRQACLAAGMNDYIAKPVRVDDLVDVLLRNSRQQK